MARPRKLIDQKQVEELARIGCTEEDMAAVLGVSVDTLQRRKRASAEFRGAIEKGRASLRNSLRRLQVKKALEGNVTMLIWLGKQLLGQSDRQNTELTGPEGMPMIPDSVVLALALAESRPRMLDGASSRPMDSITAGGGTDGPQHD